MSQMHGRGQAMNSYFDEDVRIRIREAREMNREFEEEKRERQRARD
jgi:hypothetical protein